METDIAYLRTFIGKKDSGRCAHGRIIYGLCAKILKLNNPPLSFCVLLPGLQTEIFTETRLLETSVG
jgi:hypothetical protein